MNTFISYRNIFVPSDPLINLISDFLSGAHSLMHCHETSTVLLLDSCSRNTIVSCVQNSMLCVNILNRLCFLLHFDWLIYYTLLFVHFIILYPCIHHYMGLRIQCIYDRPSQQSHDPVPLCWGFENLGATTHWCHSTFLFSYFIWLLFSIYRYTKYLTYLASHFLTSCPNKFYFLVIASSTKFGVFYTFFLTYTFIIFYL